MIVIEQAKMPVWADKEYARINLTVKFSHLDFEVPFTASPDDVEEHGRMLFINASNGVYGEILEYKEPANAQMQSNNQVLPITIQMRQFRLELLNRQLLSQVPAAIESIPDSLEKEKAKIEWEYSTTVSNDSGWVKAIFQQLGIDNTEANSIFSSAQTL